MKQQTQQLVPFVLTGIFTFLISLSFAQTPVSFKGQELIVPGKSAGKIKGLDYNPSEYESFYVIDKKNKSITFSNLQTFGLEENKDNQVDFETFTISFTDISTLFVPETPMLDPTSFGVPVYEVAISCNEFTECIPFQYNYRFSPSRELIKGTNNMSMKVYFVSEAEADAFIKELRKSLKL